MRKILLMGLLILSFTNAFADPFITFDNPSLSRTERIIKNIVEKHRHGNRAVESYNSIRAIDDNRQPAIEISLTKTSLPNEYVTIPTKDTEHGF